MIARTFALVALAIAGCHESRPRPVPEHVALIADVSHIVGQPPRVVDSLLGTPLGSAGGYRGNVQYQNGLSVGYREGRAEWIQASALGGYRYGAEVLRLFGLRAVAPSAVEGRTMRWSAGAAAPFAAITMHTHERLHGGTEYVNFFSPRFPADSVF